MDLEGIRTFVAIAELGGFTAAGRRLHRSQPAISRRLALLERELAAPLLERIRGRARLTAAGQAFLPHAEAALAALQDGQEAVRGLGSGLSGTVSLVLVGTLADTHIVDVLHRFARRSKNVRLELRTASSAEVTDLVRRGEATLGLRYFASDRPDLVSLDAGSEAMLVVAASNHPLAGRRIRNPSILSRERWIGFPPMAGERESSGHVLARQLVRAGLDAADLTLIDSLTAQKRLAQAGFGLALVPESSVGDELRRGVLVTLDVPAMATTIPITAIHRRRAYLSPAARLLLSLLTAKHRFRSRRNRR
ncbi:LysR family transcriptional regulator [Enhydrobacter sp.]|jgi:DNA-binding transcriptional LysR family regulator|uniref:LysR family transcriptional regulator n=1 Tax=Enhydrobacter sp. TaxID=1894999 RepID=UPI00261F64F5|nr:LysR family transcriptional regulator [Enhydrobacter sp.]WIM13631.1 MAG: Transcriptional regulator, LysR family [Enhydrobacter sp.]